MVLNRPGVPGVVSDWLSHGLTPESLKCSNAYIVLAKVETLKEWYPNECITIQKLFEITLLDKKKCNL